MVMVLFTMLLLCFGGCKREPLQPPTPSVLNSYRGTDKMVLQVIETLKEPVNKELLTELEKQGRINWEYKALITSRFMEGFTLRFATGSNGDYLDAEINAETMAIKLYSKQQQEQRDAMAQQELASKPNNNVSLADECIFTVYFEYSVSTPTTFSWIIIDLALRKALPTALLSSGFERDFFANVPTYKNVTGRSSFDLSQVFYTIVGLVNSASEGKFTMNIDRLDITNSCEGVQGDSPNAGAIVSLQQVAPSSGLAYNEYGKVGREAVDVVMGCYKEGGVWKGLVKKITGFYSVQVRLLPGVAEVTGPMGNTNVANFCKQVEDLKKFGNYNARWYMIRAVQAHEDVHVTRLLPYLNQTLLEIKNMAQALIAPGSLSYADALAQIKAAAWNFNWQARSLWTDLTDRQGNIDHEPGNACPTAEKNIFEPMTDYICGFSRTQTPAWPSCEFCSR